MKKNNLKVVSAVLALSSALTLGMTACGPNGGNEDTTKYTYRIYTTVSPSNWNLLTQHDDNDRQVSDYLTGKLFDFDFAFDEQGEIVEGGVPRAVFRGDEARRRYGGLCGSIRNSRGWGDGQSGVADHLAR